MIMLDSCALLWWTLEPKNRSGSALKACSQIHDQGLCISSVSLWELSIKWKRKTLDLGGVDPREFAHRLEQIENFEIISVNSAIWIESALLDWDHRDPVDRIIVATAKLHGMSVVTKDREITSFYNDVDW